MKKRDLGLIGIVLAAALILWAGIELRTREEKTVVEVTVDGKIYGEYDLSKDQKVDVGGTNTFQILGGEVRMTWADCPDQLCIRQKALDRQGRGSIICLPNRVVLQVKGEAGSGDEADIVAG